MPADLRLCDLCLEMGFVSTLDHKLEPEVAEVRRLEVITGTGRRRLFTDDFKARVVAETLLSGAVVSDVARRHGLTPQQVFTWRRQAREAMATTWQGNTGHRATEILSFQIGPSLCVRLRGGRRRCSGSRRFGLRRCRHDRQQTDKKACYQDAGLLVTHLCTEPKDLTGVLQIK
jgi:transposase-like protein